MGIADEKYVSLTTKKRSGETVSTPVWIVALADGTLGFTTDGSSGKVKRIRNFPDVTLQPCDQRGKVREGTEPVAATASIVEGDAVEAYTAAVKAKYGLWVPVINVAYKVRGLFSRAKEGPRVAVSLTLD